MKVSAEIMDDLKETLSEDEQERVGFRSYILSLTRRSVRHDDAGNFVFRFIFKVQYVSTQYIIEYIQKLTTHIHDVVL